MANNKLPLKCYTNSELIEFARAHIHAMAGNANFTTYSATNYLAGTDALQVMLTA